MMDEVANELSEIRRRVARGHVDSEVLLALLAAAGRASGPQVAQAIEILRQHEPALQPTWSDLCDWVRDWPSPPDAPEHLRSWLLEIESLGLAQEALVALPGLAPAARELTRAVGDALERFRGPIEARRDHAWFAGIAERRGLELGKTVAPWRWLRAGEVLTLIGDGEEGPTVAADLWLQGLLHSTDASLLEAEVTTNDGFRNAYTGLLRAHLAHLDVTQWTPAWSLDIARTDEDLDFVVPALEVPVPHLHQAIRVWGYEEGTYWRGPLDAQGFVAHGVQRHRYSIAQLGDFTTELSHHVPSSVHDVWHGLTSLHRVADEPFVQEGKATERLTARGEEVVEAFIASFESGVLRHALGEGHDAFERGVDTREDLDDLVRYALEARLALSLALESLSALGRSVEALSLRLATADERLRTCSSAVLLVGARDYRDLTDGVPLDRAAWWATRRVLDEQVPEAVVEGALIGGADDGKKAKVFAFPRSNEARLSTRDAHVALAAADAILVAKGACRWLADAQAPDPEVGQVPLLLFNESNGTGVVAQLSISRAEPAPHSEVWRAAQLLGEVARSAIHDAYWAVGSLCPVKFPPFSFPEHRFELVLPTDIRVSAIDGSSVGAAAALAFASLWTGAPIPRDLVATARVSPTGEVCAVGHVLEKAARLQQITSRRLRLIVGQQNLGDAATIPIGVLGTSQLGQVLAAAAIELQDLKQSHPPTSSCETRLNQLITSVRTGNPNGRHAHAWRDTADDIAWLAKVLSDGPTSSNLVEARCWAALAYLHAAEPGSARWILSGVDRDSIQRVDTRTLLDAVAVDRGIDHRTRMSDLLDTLADDARELQRTDRTSPALGYALGTLGRAYMHGGNPERAIPFLKRALEHHRENQPWEAGRSRIYLCMALRLAGDAAAGLDQLRVADEELRTNTGAYSPEYEVSCRMYLEYERSRVLVALERYEEAERAATLAEDWARWTTWPLLGILRTRAWALRMLGRDADADRDVARMEGIDIERWIKDPLVLEARGYPFEGGEVY